MNRGTWSMVRTNDDGRAVVLRSGMNAEACHILSGEFRDGLSDEEVGEGWNVTALSASMLACVLRVAQQIRGHRAAGSGNDDQATATYTRQGEEIG